MPPAKKLLHDAAIGVRKVLLKLIPERTPATFVGTTAVGDLCDAIARGGYHKVLVVTDQGLVQAGIAARITKALEACNLRHALYDGVEPDPTFAQVEAALEVLRAERCDAVVAVGGGSPMDTAKVVAAAAANAKPPRALEGLLKIGRPPVPLFAIPTTAGTGSEVTVVAVISETDTHKKKFFIDPKLVPWMAALDPSLMVGLPPAVTAATGMDALTHAVESFLCSTSTPQTEAYALASVRMVFENLPRAYRQGDDLAARRAMALASYYGGLAFTRTGVGYVHAIAHALGAAYRTPHGLANAIVLPHVLGYSRSAAAERMARLAEAIGLEGAGAEEKATRFIEAVRKLMADVGIPPVLDALKEQDIPELARQAVAEAHMNYPVPRYMSEPECEQILRQLLA